MTAGTGTGRTLRALRAGLGAAATVLPVAAYPVVFLYAHNAAQLTFDQIWLPLGVFAAAGVIILAAIGMLSRRSGPAALLTQFSILLIAYYHPLERAIRTNWAFVRYWHLAPTCGLLVFLLALHARGGRPARLELARQLARGVAAVFGALIVYNAATTAPVFRAQLRRNSHARDLRGAAAAQDDIAHTSVADRPAPDFYYILLDEYSNFDVMRRHYNHANLEFLRFLKDRAFNVSLTSSNPTWETDIELTNIMEMRRSVSQETSMLERIERYQRGRMLAFFSERGYATVVVNTIWQDRLHGDITYRGGDRTGKTDGRGETLDSMLLRQSMLHPLQLASVLQPGYIREAFTFLSHVSVLDSPMFVFSHMSCPHTPFLLDADGAAVPQAHHHDWRNKKYYLGFFRYATRRTEEVIAAILDRNPEAVIILQSDHSVRTHRCLVSNEVLVDIPEDDRRSILNAVYVRGEPLDIEGLSGLDTLLRVIEAVFGASALEEAGRD